MGIDLAPARDVVVKHKSDLLLPNGSSADDYIKLLDEAVGQIARFDACQTRAVFAFGTAEIFRRRAKQYGKRVQLLTFCGFAIPVLIGSIAAANLFDKTLLDTVIYATGLISVILGLLSLWSVIAKWQDILEYSSIACAQNDRLSTHLKGLSDERNTSNASFDSRAFDIKYAQLVALDDAQREQDNKQDITDDEKVYAHRAGLRQFRGECVACNKIPDSMKLTRFSWRRCPICGGPKKK
jgi:mobilome CxxCx(11)CxxC protein